MRIERKWIAVLGLAVAAALVAAFSFRSSGQVQYLTTKVNRGDIHDEVEATGIINAVVTVQVGSQVSGAIAKLNVDFNSRVRRGDVVAMIDPSLFQGALRQATADLENAQANVAAVEANLVKAKATLAQTGADYKRQSALAKSGAQSQQTVELAQANFEVAKSSVTAAQAAIVQAKAQVRQKEAAVAVAQTNLDYTTIRSPIDGIVVARNVDVGQTVAASLQAPTIFNIAQDLTKMQLYAKTDESDVGRIKLGQEVSFKVDAFPKDVFHGDTIIDFENAELKLFPGMTAYVTIPVASISNALKVPNTALRFRPPLPPAQVANLLGQYDITGEGKALAASPAGGEAAIVWKLRADNTLEPVQVGLGITDHAYTEVANTVKGTLNPGDEVVTASIEPRSTPGGPR
jgi:HlyD family secretion protein